VKVRGTTVTPTTCRPQTCWIIIAFMTKRAVILFLVLTVRLHAQSVIQSPECNGVIHGPVFDLSGERVKGIKIEAWPLGVDLSAVLPTVNTDQEGEYRFENVCPGRYTAIVEDKKAGYPASSPTLNEFLYGTSIAEVRLTAKHPEAELPVYLPPKPGFIQVHIINGNTKAGVRKFSVKLKVPGQHIAPEISYESDAILEEHEIQVPPDRDVILRVTAQGFHEWSESARHGKLIRVPSGTESTLEVELEPLR
jgi:hypothetical protein